MKHSKVYRLSVKSTFKSNFNLAAFETWLEFKS